MIVDTFEVPVRRSFDLTRSVRARKSLVSCKMSLKEQAILTQDEPEGREVAQAGD